MACATASKCILYIYIYFQNGTPQGSVSMITMNGKLYVHWRFIPSCHFMWQNFSWGYKTSKTILMRFHPSQEPSEKTKQPHLQPLTLVFAKLWRRSKPELSRPHVDGVPMGGLMEPSRLIMPTPFLQIFPKKMVVEMGKGKPPPFCEGLGYHLPWIIEKPNRPRNWAYFAFPSDFHANSCDWRFSSLGRMLSWRNYPPKDHLGENSEFPYQIPWWLFSIPEMIFFKCPVFWVFLQKCTIKIVIGMPTLEITSVETDTCIHIKYKYMDMH